MLGLATYLIEICTNNEVAIMEIYDLEKSFNGVSILETDCMGECELCLNKPYAFSNGTLRVGSSVPDLISLLKDDVVNFCNQFSTETRTK